MRDLAPVALTAGGAGVLIVSLLAGLWALGIAAGLVLVSGLVLLVAREDEE